VVSILGNLHGTSQASQRTLGAKELRGFRGGESIQGKKILSLRTRSRVKKFIGWVRLVKPTQGWFIRA